MTEYALGRTILFSDRSEIDNIAMKFRKQGDRLGDLISLITTSKIFHAK